MTWLILTILAYFILAAVFLVDKYLIAGPVLDPKIYAFYAGLLRLGVLILIPFVGFVLPAFDQVAMSLAAGLSFLAALFWLYKALLYFEASRIIPAIGGLVPLFSFLLVCVFSRGKEALGSWDFLAFIILVLGSVLITYENSRISLKSFGLSALSAFLFSFSFVLTKYVFLSQPFWSGFILIKMGEVIFAAGLFLFSSQLREKVFNFKKTSFFQPKTAVLYISNQAFGAGAHILQNVAIFLAPLAYLAIINALQGIQYFFLLVFALILSLKFPQFIKEKFSGRIIFQKVLATLFIGGGLGLLAF